MTTTDHLADVDQWREKVEELMSTVSDLEASEARTKRNLIDAEVRENLLRKNIEELNKQLSHHEMTTTQTKEQMNSQLATANQRLFQVQNCLETKDLSETCRAC